MFGWVLLLFSFPWENADRVQLGRLLQLLLGCAINCVQKQAYITIIMGMEESVQRVIMQAIQVHTFLPRVECLFNKFSRQLWWNNGKGCRHERLGPWSQISQKWKCSYSIRSRSQLTLAFTELMLRWNLFLAHLKRYKNRLAKIGIGSLLLFLELLFIYFFKNDFYEKLYWKDNRKIFVLQKNT